METGTRRRHLGAGAAGSGEEGSEAPVVVTLPSQEEIEAQKLARNNISASLGLLFGLVTIVLGGVFPIAHFLSFRDAKHASYFHTYHIYLYGVSIIVLIGLIYVIWKHLKKEPQDDQQDQISHENSEGPQRIDSAEHPGVSLHGEGINRFMQFGLVGFALGLILMACFNLAGLFHSSTSYECFSVALVIMYLFLLLFTVIQTIFLLMYNKVVLHCYLPVVRLGLIHLIATNVCLWAALIIMEAVETLGHSSEGHEEEGEEHAEVTSSILKAALLAASNISTSHDTTTKPGPKTATQCFVAGNLSSEVSPYLFPFAIEFALLSAAIFYRILTHVGKHPEKESEEPEETAPVLQVYKEGALGMILGLLVFFGALAGVIISIHYDSINTNDEYLVPMGYIQFILDITLNSISLIAVIIGFYQMKILSFRDLLADTFDQSLILISIVGTYCLILFEILASVATIHKYDSPFAGLNIAAAVLSFVQATLQVAFIFTGMRRRAVREADFRNKPGLNVCFFLLYCNLGMWTVNSFLLKDLAQSPRLAPYFGKLAWDLIVHIMLPFAVFFRFHCCVCLSDVIKNLSQKHRDK